VTASAVVTIIGVALLVLVLAAYLIYVVFALKGVSAKLGEITAGLALIPGKTAPIAPILGEINNDLATVESRLHTVLTRKREPKAPAPPPPPSRPSRPPEPAGRSELPAPWVVVPRARPARPPN
jgi:hypothetical protein